MLGITYFLTLSVLMHRLPCTFFLVDGWRASSAAARLSCSRIGTRWDLERFITRREYSEKQAVMASACPILKNSRYLVRPSFIKGIVHIPFPGYLVKVLWDSTSMLFVVAPWPMSWRTVCLPWGVWRARWSFLDLPAHRQTRLSQHPARELCRLDGNCYGTSGNVLINQPYPSFP